MHPFANLMQQVAANPYKGNKREAAREALARQIKDLYATGISQREIAHQLGCSQTHVFEMLHYGLNPKTNPTLNSTSTLNWRAAGAN